MGRRTDANLALPSSMPLRSNPQSAFCAASRHRVFLSGWPHSRSHSTRRTTRPTHDHSAFTSTQALPGSSHAPVRSGVARSSRSFMARALAVIIGARLETAPGRWSSPARVTMARRLDVLHLRSVPSRDSRLLMATQRIWWRSRSMDNSSRLAPPVSSTSSSRASLAWFLRAALRATRPTSWSEVATFRRGRRRTSASLGRMSSTPRGATSPLFSAPHTSRLSSISTSPRS